MFISQIILISSAFALNPNLQLNTTTIKFLQGAVPDFNSINYGAIDFSIREVSGSLGETLVLVYNVSNSGENLNAKTVKIYAQYLNNEPIVKFEKNSINIPHSEQGFLGYKYTLGYYHVNNRDLDGQYKIITTIENPNGEVLARSIVKINKIGTRTVTSRFTGLLTANKLAVPTITKQTALGQELMLPPTSDAIFQGAFVPTEYIITPPSISYNFQLGASASRISDVYLDDVIILNFQIKKKDISSEELLKRNIILEVIIPELFAYVPNSLTKNGVSVEPITGRPNRYISFSQNENNVIKLINGEWDGTQYTFSLRIRPLANNLPRSSLNAILDLSIDGVLGQMFSVGPFIALSKNRPSSVSGLPQPKQPPARSSFQRTQTSSSTTEQRIFITKLASIPNEPSVPRQPSSPTSPTSTSQPSPQTPPQPSNLQCTAENVPVERSRFVGCKSLNPSYSQALLDYRCEGLSNCYVCLSGYIFDPNAQRPNSFGPSGGDCVRVTPSQPNNLLPCPQNYENPDFLGCGPEAFDGQAIENNRYRCESINIMGVTIPQKCYECRGSYKPRAIGFGLHCMRSDLPICPQFSRDAPYLGCYSTSRQDSIELSGYACPTESDGTLQKCLKCRDGFKVVPRGFIIFCEPITTGAFQPTGSVIASDSINSRTLENNNVELRANDRAEITIWYRFLASSQTNQPSSRANVKFDIELPFKERENTVFALHPQSIRIDDSAVECKQGIFTDSDRCRVDYESTAFNVLSKRDGKALKIAIFDNNRLVDEQWHSLKFIIVTGAVARPYLFAGTTTESIDMQGNRLDLPPIGFIRSMVSINDNRIIRDDYFGHRINRGTETPEPQTPISVPVPTPTLTPSEPTPQPIPTHTPTDPFAGFNGGPFSAPPPPETVPDTPQLPPTPMNFNLYSLDVEPQEVVANTQFKVKAELQRGDNGIAIDNFEYYLLIPDGFELVKEIGVFFDNDKIGINCDSPEQRCQAESSNVCCVDSDGINNIRIKFKYPADNNRHIIDWTFIAPYTIVEGTESIVGKFFASEQVQLVRIDRNFYHTNYHIVASPFVASPFQPTDNSGVLYPRSIYSFGFGVPSPQRTPNPEILGRRYNIYYQGIPYCAEVPPGFKDSYWRGVIFDGDCSQHSNPIKPTVLFDAVNNVPNYLYNANNVRIGQIVGNHAILNS